MPTPSESSSTTSVGSSKKKQIVTEDTETDHFDRLKSNGRSTLYESGTAKARVDFTPVDEEGDGGDETDYYGGVGEYHAQNTGQNPRVSSVKSAAEITHFDDDDYYSGGGVGAHEGSVRGKPLARSVETPAGITEDDEDDFSYNSTRRRGQKPPFSNSLKSPAEITQGDDGQDNGDVYASRFRGSRKSRGRSDMSSEEITPSGENHSRVISLRDEEPVSLEEPRGSRNDWP
jgi:hypothetical protein